MKTTSTSNGVAARNSGKATVLRATLETGQRRRAVLKRILLPVDSSAGSRLAFDYAVELEEQNDSPIHRLHVIEKPTLPVFECPVLALRDKERLLRNTELRDEFNGKEKRL